MLGAHLEKGVIFFFFFRVKISNFSLYLCVDNMFLKYNIVQEAIQRKGRCYYSKAGLGFRGSLATVLLFLKSFACLALQEYSDEIDH